MKKLFKQVSLLICSFVMAICAGIAVDNLSTEKVAAEASTVKYDNGMQTASLTQINPKLGVTAEGVEVEFVEFSGMSGDTWFMVEFSGRNVPNFAINAPKSYEKWNGEPRNSAGVLLCSTYEKDEKSYAWAGMQVTNGLNTSSVYGNWNGTFPEGPGAGHLGKCATIGPNSTYDTSLRYLLILGATDPDAGSTTISWNLYLVNEQGGLQKISEQTYTKGVTAPYGSKAIIYPNIGISPNGNAAQKGTVSTTKITFDYARPGSSIDELINNLPDNSCYKAQLMEEYEVQENDGLKSVTLGTINPVKGVTPVGEFVESVSFSGLAGDTFFLVDFIGANVPNFAVNATQVYTKWNGENDSKAGVLLAQTRETTIAKKATPAQLEEGVSVDKDGYIIDEAGARVQFPSFTHTNLISAAGLNTASHRATTNGENLLGPGLGFIKNGGSDRHNIMIIGTERIPGGNRQKVHYYLFTESEGTLTLAKELHSADYNTLGYKGDVAVIYPSIGIDDRGYVATPGTVATYDYDISFKYAEPAASIEALIAGIGDSYEYKEQLEAHFNVIANKATVQNENGETIAVKEFIGDFTLPYSATAGFIGYEYDGGLYPAGAKITVENDITVKEVCLDFEMIKGASVRKGYNENAYGGLRFQVTANAATVEKWADSISLTGIIIPTDLISATFNINEANAQMVALNNYITEEGVNTYYITLTNINYTNYNRNFSAMAYATITYATGETTTIVTDYDNFEKSYARSVYAVAKEALAAGESDPAGVLAQYVNYTVNLVKDGENYTTKDTGVKYSVEGKVVTVSEIPENLAKKAQNGKILLCVTVWEGEIATRTIYEATYADGVATLTLN